MAPALDPSYYPEYAAECGDPSRTMKLGCGQRPALLLLDLCEAYLSDQSPLKLPAGESERVAASVASMLDAARSSKNESSTEQQVPVIYAQTIYKHATLRDAGLQAIKNPQLSSLFHVANRNNLVHLPREGHERLQPAPSDIRLDKKYPSPFFGTNFSTQLSAMGVDTLIIAGFTTSGNVRSTALDAMQAGFRPMVVAEACGDRGKETHWANLMDVGAKYGDVMSVEDAVSVLEKGWGIVTP